MNNAIILHGICDKHEYLEMDFPSPSNAHWIPWLQQKFLRDGVLCQALEMPTPYDAKYEEWKMVFSHVQLNDDSIIVAHSAGCGFILKWLQEHPLVSLKKLVLIAPWLDPSRKMGTFLECTLNPDLSQRVQEMHLFYSHDEPVDGVAQTKEQILSVYPETKLHTFENMGHFCLSDMGTNQFPALWAVVT